MVPSWGYQLFVCGYKLMAYGRFCFPPWGKWQMWRFVIQCSNHLGFNPCDLQNSHGDILKGHSLRTIVFTVFQGPILFILLIQFLGSPESYGKLLQKTPKMACSIMFRKLVISSLHPVQPVLQLSFSKMSCIPPKWKGFGHVMFFSQ